MTKDYAVLANVSYNLEDAKEELEEILKLIQPDLPINDEIENEFNVRMAHLYWHLNSAWNTRNLTERDLELANKEKLDLWGEFPKDLKPL